MSDQREMVARIIDPEAWAAIEDEHDAMLWGIRRERALDKAAAVLAALSPDAKPTPGMIDAGLEAFFSFADLDGDVYGERIAAVYIAMERARVALL